jgi:chromosome segregation ATPase
MNSLQDSLEALNSFLASEKQMLSDTVNNSSTKYNEIGVQLKEAKDNLKKEQIKTEFLTSKLNETDQTVQSLRAEMQSYSDLEEDI